MKKLFLKINVVFFLTFSDYTRLNEINVINPNKFFYIFDFYFSS